MSGLRFVVEDRKADAVAHLAVARSQNTGNGILGEILMIKAVVLYGRFFHKNLSQKKKLPPSSGGAVIYKYAGVFSEWEKGKRSGHRY